MEIELTRKFKKQIDECKQARIRKKVTDVIDAVIIAESLSDIKNIKKLKGSENSYRIRVSDYRIGIVLMNEKCVFAAFDHRSDIYRYFP